MNRQEFVEAIANKSNLSGDQAESALVAFIDVVTEALQDGDKISLVNFGSFETSERSARTGRNPQTGAEMQIPAATVPKFKPGKKLKDAVNKDKQ